MPRPDPLKVLAKLRGIERDRARRAMADAQAGLSAALAAEAAVEGALVAEAAHAPADYAAWLPAAERARNAARLGTVRAEASAELARAALVEARARAEAVETLLATRRAEARAVRLAAEQVRLDDVRRQ